MKYWITFIACVLLCGNGMCFHIPGRFEIVNILVNKENNAILPENIFDLRLEKGSAYSVEYNVKKVIDDAEKAVIAKKMGTVPVPEFRYVSNGERMLGVMPPNIRLMFDNLDALCATNGMDGLAVSIDSKLLNNGELARGIHFVITNTPPTPEVVSKMHPVFGKLLSPEFEMKGASATNGIPIGANPIQWLRAADNDASSIRCEYLSKEFTNGMLISPVGTMTKFSNLRILAAKNAAGVATFPVKAKFVDGDNAGELIYDVCSSNGLLRMSSCVTYDLVGIIETPTSITGDVSLVERLVFDSLSTVASITMEAPDCSMKICELDVCDKVKFGDSIEVLWPRSIDSYRITETRTGYFDDNLRTDVFSLASYSESKSNFLSLYAVYDKEGVPFGWGMVEGTANSNHNAQQNVTLRRYGETDKYDVQVHESGNKRLLKLSIRGKSRSFLLQRE